MGSFEITLTFHSGSLFIYVGYFIWGTRFKSIDSALFETTHLAGCWQVHDSKRSRNPILNVIFILSDLFQLTFKNFSTSLYSFSCHLVQLITLIFLPIVLNNMTHRLWLHRLLHMQFSQCHLGKLQAFQISSGVLQKVLIRAGAKRFVGCFHFYYTWI